MEKTETNAGANEHTNVTVQQARFKRDLAALCDRAESFALTRLTNQRTPSVDDILGVLDGFAFYVDKTEALTLMRIALDNDGDKTIPLQLTERLEIAKEADRLRLAFAGLMGVGLSHLGVPMWVAYISDMDDALDWWWQ